MAVVASTCALIPTFAPPASAATLPGFVETTVFSGLTNPTVVRFSPDGRVFVAEKSGIIKSFDNLGDTTPTVFADLRADVYNFWDRGLLGMVLSPTFPTDPSLYALYARDALPGGTSPHWGTATSVGDPCPSPPGPTADGCVVTGRLVRLNTTGPIPKTLTDATVLVDDWCQQYPSHSIGTVEFGADGFLYASGGDGASFGFADYGQEGDPVNPCGDPPAGVGGAMTAPTAEGGALRSQDVRTSADPQSLDGSIIRIDPATGAGAPDNPLATSADANAKRIVATGMRNPFRFTIRPGTNEIFAGDVGWNTWEEINRIPTPADSAVDNLGWPCYEGSPRMSNYDNLNLDICENLYAAGAGAVSTPTFAYNHANEVATGDGCPTGGSAIAGLAFYEGGPYPAEYDGALFFTDYNRKCIWSMRAGGNGQPNPASVALFASAATGAVNLEIGPGGDLFYVEFNGTIRRLSYSLNNQPPNVVVTANPTSGDPPLTVNYSAAGSTDPEGQPMTAAWDLDNDGQFDDALGFTASATYTTPGSRTVRVRVSDVLGASSVGQTTVTVGTPPVATITSPTASTTWAVGDVINIAGSATDNGSPMPGSALTWDVTMFHCSSPDNCHAHPVTSFTGSTGTFVAPDHDYPSYVEIKLTSTDGSGLTDVETVTIHPRTTNLTIATNPPGLVASIGGNTQTTPFTKQAIVGATYTLSTSSPQSQGGTTYVFGSWSDGGAISHNVTVPATDTTYSATFNAQAGNGLVAAYGFEELSGATTGDAAGAGHTGTISGATRTASGRHGRALTFDGVNDLVSVPDANDLDLTNAMTVSAWVQPSALTGWRTVVLKEAPSGLAYALYSADAFTNGPAAYASIGGTDRLVDGGGPLAAGAWRHLAMTYDGTTLRFFVDGVQTGTTTIAGNIATSGSPLVMGGNNVWGEWFAGTIDDVRVYNKVLTAAQIAGDMNAAVGAPEADTAVPTAPSNLAATGSVGQAALSWTAATDNVGVAGYRVHRSNTSGFTPQPANQIATTSTPGYTDVVAAGTWFYKVVAFDAAGNVSPASNQASATVTSDTTGPSVSVTAPANGATVSGVVALAASASDSSGVASVQFRVDGANVGAADTSSPYGASWDTSGLAAGSSHAITAVAVDGLGNSSTSATVTVTVAAAPPAPVPVAAYNFNAGSGTTLADRTGNGRTGTISGATWTAAGHAGGALSFDGVNDSVSIADHSSLDFTNAFTLEAWVRPTSTSGWRTIVLKERPGGLCYGLYASGAGIPANGVASVGGTDREVRAPSALPVNTWSHVALTYNGSTMRLYVNATEVATLAVAGSAAVSAGALKLGGNAVWGEWFAGQLDDVRLYSQVLTAGQITNDRNTPVG